MARKITGTLTSMKSTNTVVVTVTERRQHAKYKKAFLRSKNFHAHYEGSALEIGQSVTIEETAPMSRLKCWKVVL